MSALRVAFISDLHLDHNPGLLPLLEERLREVRASVFIIAGDMFSGMSRLEAALKRIRKCCENVLFLPGNHDLWVNETNALGNSRNIYENVMRRTVHRAGAHYLGMEPFFIDGIAVCGVTGWYDAFPSPPITTPDEKLCNWPEFSTPADVLEWQLGILESQLTLASEKARKIIAVTHTVPFLDRIKKQVSGELLAYMGSQRLGDCICRFPKVVYAISGHIHVRMLHSLPQGFPWEVSPFGYPRELGDDPKKVMMESLRLIEV
ncbi:metallophosphoesterase [Myxococcota bacterium]|nr:metallophosphoesterase [Myxococcota bacterium]MBU1537899.1 metallophosphoesterase [Myxococcota bacterium]